MTAPTSEVLNLAADLIEEKGWGKGPTAMTGESGVCIMGAIHAATFGALPASQINGYVAVEECPAGVAVANYLGRGPATRLWEWNDYQVETATEVIEVLRACAVIEASRERQPVGVQ